MSLLKVNEIQIFNGETVTITAPAVVSANDNTNAALRITQTGTGNALVVEDSTNPDSTPFVVNTAGRVGIGVTTVARGPLHVHEVGANASQVHLTNDTTGANDTDGTTFYNAGVNAGIFHRENGYFLIATNNTERMRIDSAGNVGIGTSSPSEKLEVVGSADAVLRLTDLAPIGTVNRKVGGIEFYQNDASGGAGIGSSIEAYHVNISGDTDLRFATGDNTERMRIDSSGNVGIGTNSPAQKLDVSGNINATGALTLGTALAIAEGGTGATDAATARINLDVDQAGTDNSTDCTLVTTSHDYLSITGQSITLGPIDLAADVTGSLPYASISGTPTLGTAAAEDVGYFATAAQGTLADSAVQPGDDANTLGSGTATDGYVLTADGAGNAAWEAASGGGGGTTAYLEHSSTISDSFTVSSGTNRMYIGGTTFSGTISVAGRLAIVAGPANFTGTINVTGTLAIME